MRAPSGRWKVGILIVCALVIVGIWLMARYHFRLYAHVALGIAAAGGVALMLLGEPDRHRVQRHAFLSMAITLVLTWALALVCAAIVAAASKKEPWFATLLLSANSIGGLFALQRSARTRSETGAGLREVSALRVASLSAPLVEQRVTALEALTVEELVQIAVRMLRLAVSLPLTPSSHLVDKAALWGLDDETQTWLVVASSSMASSDRLSFPAVTIETPGAGVIPNLAVAGEPPAHGRDSDVYRDANVFLCPASIRTHAWFRAEGGGTSEGMAVVLLRHNGRLLGALSLTSRESGAIPVVGSERREMIDILELWAKSFVVPLARFYSLKEASR